MKAQEEEEEDSDYEQSRINEMEKQINFQMRRNMEEKVGSKEVETREKIKLKKRDEKAK